MKKDIETVTVMKDNLDALADNIAALADVGEAIKSSKLNERTILMLLASSSGLYQHQVKSVLKALTELSATYLK